MVGIWLIRSIHFDPDIYMDVQGLPDPFEVAIDMLIRNDETIDLYFRASLVTPPPGYSDYTHDLGLIAAGTEAYKRYTFKRAQPTLIDGELDETITLLIQAFKDAAYTDLYGEGTFPLTMHYFDHTDPAWTELYHDNFDDGTTQTWTGIAELIDPAIPGYGPCGATDLRYLSPYYSLMNYSTSGYSIAKDYTVGTYTKARITVHYNVEPGTRVAWALGGELIKPGRVPVPSDVWLRFSRPLPVNATTRLAAQADTLEALYIDEVVVVAK